MKELNSYQRHCLEGMFAYRIPMLVNELEKGSTGVIGKFFEDLRIIVNTRPSDVLKCRAANKVDLRIGRNLHIEVKTGSGAVAYAEGRDLPFTAEDLTADNVFPGMHEIIWCPFPPIPAKRMLESMTSAKQVQYMLELLLKNAWVFTRDEFIELLENMGKRGVRSCLKLSKGGHQINLQTISHGLEARFWEQVEGRPTAYDILIK